MNYSVINLVLPNTLILILEQICSDVYQKYMSNVSKNRFHIKFQVDRQYFNNILNITPKSCYHSFVYTNNTNI